MEKIVITAAVTGAFLSKEHHPALRMTLEEIRDEVKVVMTPAPPSRICKGVAVERGNGQQWRPRAHPHADRRYAS